MHLVLETHVGFDQPPRALDIDVIEAIDEDIADGRVFEQRLERAEAEDLV